MRFVRANRGRPHRSDRYAELRRTAGWESKAQRTGRIDGPVEVSIAAGRPDRRCRDIDNLAKSLLDLLQANRVIERHACDGDNNAPWSEVRDELNRCLRGWSTYFCYGARRSAFRSVDHYVRERVRTFLARRHKVAGRGHHQFSLAVLHGERGVLCLERLP
jgi:hypothetical protein